MSSDTEVKRLRREVANALSKDRGATSHEHAALDALIVAVRHETSLTVADALPPSQHLAAEFIRGYAARYGPAS